jgi:hypothetical protein
MLSKGGRKGQRRIHSLLCSLEEKEKGKEDENCCIGRGEESLGACFHGEKHLA